MRSLNAWAAQQPPTSEDRSPETSAASVDNGNSFSSAPSQPPHHITDKPSIFVAGSLAIDLACDYALSDQPRAAGAATLKPAHNTSNPAVITQSLGGVGSNVARAAHLLGPAPVRLCSAVGDDLGGTTAREALAALHMDAAGVQTLPHPARTAQYVAVNDSARDLVLAMADMSILESDAVSHALQTTWLPQLRAAAPSHLVLDANWSAAHLASWLAAGAAAENRPFTIFEPVSNAKSIRPFHLPPHTPLGTFPNHTIDVTTPNRYELSAMHAAAGETAHLARKDWWAVIDALGIPSSGARAQLTHATSRALVDAGVPQQSLQLLPFFPTICAKLGAEGVLLTQLLPANDPRLQSGDAAPYILSRCANGTEGSLGVGGVYMRLFPAAEVVGEGEVVSVNGVGDTFVGALVAGLAAGERVEDAVDRAQRAAVLTLRSRESVAPGLGGLL